MLQEFVNFGCFAMSRIGWMRGSSEVVARARAISASGISASAASRISE